MAKDQLLETEPDATRSGMAIETGEPIPTSLPPHPCECAAKPVGVRAIPADHDVYPWGDEPSGAMIQTELSSHPLRNVSKSPSGPVFSSQCQQNRQTLRSRSSTRLQTFSSSLDDGMSLRSTARPPPPNLAVRLWWSLSGSNRRPPACKAGALPAELRPLARSQAPHGPAARR